MTITGRNVKKLIRFFMIQLNYDQTWFDVVKDEALVKKIHLDLNKCFLLEFEFVSPSIYEYLTTDQTLEQFILHLGNVEHWKNADKTNPKLFCELFKKFSAKYSAESVVESFVRYKSELESGTLGNASNLKRGDRSRLLLGSRAARVSNVRISTSLHFRNQNRWNRLKGTRKQPRILGEFLTKA